MSDLPKDPFILLSYVNTKLRDEYGSLKELCRALDVECDDIRLPLLKIGYEYDAVNNCFK